MRLQYYLLRTFQQKLMNNMPQTDAANLNSTKSIFGELLLLDADLVLGRGCAGHTMTDQGGRQDYFYKPQDCFTNLKWRAISGAIAT